MSSPSSKTLTLRSDPDAEVLLVQGDFLLLQGGVGALTRTGLRKGIYKLKVVRAGKVAERLIEFPADGTEFDLRVDRIETLLPSSADYEGNPDQIKKIDDFLNGLSGDGAVEETVSLAQAKLPRVTDPNAPPLARGMVAVKARAGSRNAGSQAAGDRGELVMAAAVDSVLESWLSTVRLQPYAHPDTPPGDAGILDNLGRITELELDGKDLRAFRADLPTGIYRVAGSLNGRMIQITVPLLPGRQTRIFVRRREVEVERRREVKAGSDMPPAEWAGLAMQMKRPGASFVVTRHDDYAEVIRVALAQGRPIIVSGARVNEMLDAKYDDPLVGIAGAHLMLAALERQEAQERRAPSAAPEFDRAAIGTVLKNMARKTVLGSYASLKHPAQVLSDIVALHIRAGLAGDIMLRIAHPPVFWESWKVLVADDSQHAVLDPALRRAAGAALAWGPYLVFACQAESKPPPPPP